MDPTQTAPAPSNKLNLKNIQGDILSGLPKKTENYYFFNIRNGPQFRKDLCKLVPLITSVDQVIKDRKRIDDHKKQKRPGLVPLTGVNISFTHKGFVKLGINDDTLSAKPANPDKPTDPFIVGQKSTAVSVLGDPARADGEPDWIEPFLNDEIHGLFIISGDSHESIEKKTKEVEEIFRVPTSEGSLRKVTTVRGDVRPDELHAHEHFGFLDGISNPQIQGFDTINPGPVPVDAGVILTGQPTDTVQRAEWARDGSFLAFRWLDQLVPEFDKYLVDNALTEDGNGRTLTPAEGAELLGARMVGRWKSGAPIDLAPFKDDPKLAKDPKRNNNFRYEDEINSQLRCPFAAHVRKTNPRNDLEVPPNINPIPVSPNRIMRRGIQFGQEVTDEEKASGKTKLQRGLLFACYQSNLEKGFQFIQRSWANNQTFPPFEKQPEAPGLDPIVGQGSRSMSGLDPLNPQKMLTMPAFVVPRGGEYFFAPSLKGLKDTIAVAA
ncbi:peroxidase TAP [Panaeolus papilionaceus]|nr:peroxidase TAP [Panaeolus papilionaceus]